VRVFVYGSLKRGEQYHDWLCGARFVGAHVTAPTWRFWDLGGYPAMSPGGDVAVAGEVFDVDEAMLARLDELEEVPELYQRARMETEYGECWVYLVWEAPAGAKALADGVWPSVVP